MNLFFIYSRLRFVFKMLIQISVIFLVTPTIQFIISKLLLMHFDVHQSFIKHNDYEFMKIILYRGNTNFTKQHKSTPNTGWLLLGGTKGFSHLEREKI